MILIYQFIVMLWMPVSLGILLGYKIEKKKKIQHFLFLFSIMFFLSNLLGDERGMLIVMVAEGLVMRLWLKLSWINLLYIPFSYVEIMICNLIAQILAKSQFSSAEEQLIQMSPYKECFAIIVMLSIIVLSIITRELINIIGNRIFIISKEAVFLVVFDLVVCTIVFMISSWINRQNDYPEVHRVINLSMMLYIMLMIIISFVIYKFAKEKAQIAQEKKMQEELQEYTKQIERMYHNIRSFKHDYVNILMALTGYMEEKDYVGMEKYFTEHILPTNQKLNSDNFRLSSLSNIKESGLKGLVSSKLIYAHEMGIDTYIDIMEPVDKFPMNLLDLMRVFGIYLDNAIDATLECDRKEIKFNIINEEKSITIILMNTFIDKGIQLERIGTHSYTSKGEERGLGLYNVKEILRKYGNVFKETAIKDGYFIQTLVLEK